MDFPALSMIFSQMSFQTKANVSMMEKTIDQAETNGQDVVEMLEQFVQAHFGSQLNIRD